MLNAWDEPEYGVGWCRSCQYEYTPVRLEQKYCSKHCKRAASEWRKRGCQPFDTELWEQKNAFRLGWYLPERIRCSRDFWVYYSLMESVRRGERSV